MTGSIHHLHFTVQKNRHEPPSEQLKGLSSPSGTLRAEEKWFSIKNHFSSARKVPLGELSQSWESPSSSTIQNIAKEIIFFFFYILIIEGDFVLEVHDQTPNLLNNTPHPVYVKEEKKLFFFCLRAPVFDSAVWSCFSIIMKLTPSCKCRRRKRILLLLSESPSVWSSCSIVFLKHNGIASIL